jgi:tetratricopeptide (TPR) repeat protein
MRQAALAVHFAHQQGIIHRDLKPPNIMVAQVSTSTTTHAFAPGSRESVQVFVMDFGLAKTMSVDSSLSASGTVIGTPMYMSPEQAQANRAVDARADVYSLGATLYEILTDTPPFTGSNIFNLLQKIISEDPLPVRRIKPEVSPELETIAMKCLEKDPGRRYQSAMEFAEELTRWLEGEAILAHPPSGFYRLRKRVAKNPWAWGMSATAGVIGVFGLLILWLLSSIHDATQEASMMVQKIERHYDQGDYASAEAMAKKAIALAPNHSDARYWLARLLIRQYQQSRGIPEARIVRGTPEFVPLRPENATEKHWREAVLQEAPNQEMILGIVAMWNQKYAEAESNFKNVRPDTPGAWEAEFYRGMLRYFQADFAEAVKLLRPHKNRDPRLTLPVWVRALTAFAQDKEQHGEDAADLYTEAEGASLEVHEPLGKILRAQVLIARAKGESAYGLDVEERHRKAIDLLRGIDDPEAYVTLGDVYLAQAEDRRTRGDVDPPYDAAIEAYGKATFASAHFRRGEAIAARFQFDQQFGKLDADRLRDAEEEYQKALGLNPEYIDPAIGLARVRRVRSGNFEEEIKTLDGLAARRPHDPAILFARAHAWRGLAHTRQRGPAKDSIGAYLAAIRDLDALVAANSKNGVALLARSEARLGVAQGIFAEEKLLSLDFQTAVDDASRAIEVNPKNSEAYAARALARQSLAHHRSLQKQDAREEFEAAVKDASRALELNPRNVNAYRIRGTAYQNWGWNEAALGRPTREWYDKGVEDLSRAVALNKNDSESLHIRGTARGNLAAFLFEHRQPYELELEAAAADYAEAVRINPGHAQAHLRRGMVLGALKRFDEADASFDKCIDADPSLKAVAEEMRQKMRQR